MICNYISCFILFCNYFEPIYLYTLKWFQILLINICNFIHQTFLFNTNKLLTGIFSQITNNSNNPK